MHQGQSVLKQSVISEKIKIQLKTAHFSYTSDRLVTTTPFVHRNIPTPLNAFICNTNPTLWKKEGQGIFYFVRDITFTVFPSMTT